MTLGRFICDATDCKWKASLYEGGAVVFFCGGNYEGSAQFDRGSWSNIHIRSAIDSLPRLDLLAFEFERYPKKAPRQYPPWPKDEPGLT